MGRLNKKDCYLAQEIADKFGISKKTLFKWESEGKIPKAPKDWRGWRVYSKTHFKPIAKIITGKMRKVS
jgi:DNA-binding transcriptional MerR regulator